MVEENVLRVANNRGVTLSPECVAACIEFLERCQASQSLVLDDSYQILTKYASHCNHAGSPGVGDYFFVWARDNVGTLTRVAVPEHDDRKYQHFPSDPRLAKFDWDDRIYVAAAVAHGQDCEIVNSADSDYREAHDALKDHVHVVELCESELKR